MAQLPTFKAYTTTAVAPVAAAPTTAAHFAIWNPPLSGKSLYIQTIEGFTLASAGAAQIIQTFAHLSASVTNQRIGSAFTASGVPFSLGGVVQNSVASVGSAVTIVNDSVWHACSDSNTMGAGTTTIGSGTYSNVNGIYVVAPGMVFSLAVVCSAAGSATCKLGVTWYEA